MTYTQRGPKDELMIGLRNERQNYPQQSWEDNRIGQAHPKRSTSGRGPAHRGTKRLRLPSFHLGPSQRWEESNATWFRRSWRLSVTPYSPTADTPTKASEPPTPKRKHRSHRASSRRARSRGSASGTGGGVAGSGRPPSAARCLSGWREGEARALAAPRGGSQDQSRSRHSPLD